MKKVIPIILVVLALGCTRHEAEQINHDKQITKSHLIPLNAALNLLNQFLEADETDVKNTKNVTRIPSSVSTVRAGRLASMTKGSSPFDTLNCDELLYIINFLDEKGYAILAADDRISERLLMVSDSGSLDNEGYYAHLSNSPFPYQTKSSGEGLIIYDV